MISIERLAFKNIFRNPFRSLVVTLSAGLVAAAIFAMVMLLRGAEAGLRASLARLGADFIIIPFGGLTSREEMKTVRIMTPPINNWMPRETLEQILKIPGVAAVSPQLYILTEEGGPYIPRLYLVAFDVQSDFTIHPWVMPGWDGSLADGEALVGNGLDVPESGQIKVAGYPLQVVGRLERTENIADQTVFVTYATAKQLVDATGYDIGYESRYMDGRMSAIMLRVDTRSSVRDVYLRILSDVDRVRPLSTTDMFQTEREQLVGLLRSAISLLVAIIVLAIAFVFLVYTIAVNERAREIGVLRALGFPRTAIVRTLIYEGTLLALFGGLLGSIAAGGIFYLLKDSLYQNMDILIEPPGLLLLIGLFLGGMLLALIGVITATLLPALRITRLEAAYILQE
jgi:putative ABC transport system permease protein